MKIKILKEFSLKLSQQVEFIAQDKPKAARKFKNELMIRLKEIPTMPYKHKQSIYYTDANIRDCVYKGYKITYRIKPLEEIIEVFGLTKNENTL